VGGTNEFKAVHGCNSLEVRPLSLSLPFRAPPRCELRTRNCCIAKSWRPLGKGAAQLMLRICEIRAEANPLTRT